jgi:hypothetical protein
MLFALQYGYYGVLRSRDDRVDFLNSTTSNGFSSAKADIRNT